MRFAKTRSGEIVSALKWQSRHARFVCPLCSAPVLFRKGTGKRIAHFAHRKGYGTTACEEYHPTLHSPLVDKPQHPNRQDVQPWSYDSPRIYLEWHETEIGFDYFDLILELPASHKSGGKMVVVLGPSTKQQVKVTTGIRPLRYRLDIHSMSYGVTWCSTDVDKDYRQAVTNIIEGPRSNEAMLFSRSGDLAKDIGSSSSYLLLLHSTLESGLLLPLELKGKRDDWLLCEVKLDELDEDEISLLCKSTGLPLSPLRTKITTLGIPYVTASTPSDIACKENSELLVRVEVSGTGHQQLTEIECTYSDEEKGLIFNAREPSPATFLMLKTGNSGQTFLNAHGAVLSIRNKVTPFKANLSPRALIRSKSGEAELSPHCPENLIEDLFALNSDSELLAPTGVAGTVVVKTNTSARNFRIGQLGETFFLESAYDLAEVREAIGDTSEEAVVTLNLGNYGHCSFVTSVSSTMNPAIMAEIDLLRAKEVIRSHFTNCSPPFPLDLERLAVSEINFLLDKIELDQRSRLRYQVLYLRGKR